MYNQATQEIAKPSELLTSVRAYMTVLQSIENYVQIDITRVFNNVLLQQTQHLDSHGEPTITSLYTNWWDSTYPFQNGHRVRMNGSVPKPSILPAEAAAF